MRNAILIDDEQIASEVLGILLREIGGVSVVGTFMQVSDALERASELRPELIFLDIEMPGIDGITGAGLLLERCPGANVIFVTAHPGYAEGLQRVGVLGYLLKPVMKERLAKLLKRHAASGAVGH